jgi:hypothetical protein
MKKLRKFSPYWLILVVPVLMFLCTLVSIRIVNSMDYHHNDNDFFTFWLAGHIVSQGSNPYDSATWIAGYHEFKIDVIANPTFLYPLPLALLLAPIGLLPFHTAYIAWVTMLQFVIIASFVLLLFIPGLPRTKFFFLPLLAGLVLFRPTILTLTQGQIIGFLLFVLVGIAALFKKGRWGWGGVLLGLLVLKPNLGLIIILLTGVWLAYHRHWKALIGATSSALVLLIIGLVYNPGWVGEYLQVGGSKLAQTFGASPTVWGLSALACRVDTTCTSYLGGISSLLIFGFSMWLLYRSKNLTPLEVLGLVVTVTLLIAPYTWTYDQLLLLIPIVPITLALDGKRGRFLLAISFFLILDLFLVIILIFDSMLGVEILNVILPLIIFGILAWQVLSHKTLSSGVKSHP